jgi:hypothetical protein
MIRFRDTSGREKQSLILFFIGLRLALETDLRFWNGFYAGVHIVLFV